MSELKTKILNYFSLILTVIKGMSKFITDSVDRSIKKSEKIIDNAEKRITKYESILDHYIKNLRDTYSLHNIKNNVEEYTVKIMKNSDIIENERKKIKNLEKYLHSLEETHDEEDVELASIHKSDSGKYMCKRSSKIQKINKKSK